LSEPSPTPRPPTTLPPISSTRPPRSLRADITFAFAIAIGIYVVWMVHDVLLIVYVSALFAVVLMPVVNGLRRIRIGNWQPSRVVAILLLFLIVFSLAALFFAFALPPVVSDMSQFIRELPVRGPQLLARAQQLPLVRHLDLSALNAKLQDFASSSASFVLISVRNGAGRFFDLLTGVILTVYFMLEGEHAYAWFLSFFPQEQRSRLDRTLSRAELRMGKWLLGQASLMLTLGLVSTIAFLALKVRYAYALGVLMGAFNLVPILGALISVSLALLVAAIDSWGRALGVLIVYLVYAQLENSVLTPRIMQKSVGLSGLAVLISLMLGASIAGVVGALVSVPTAVLVGELINEYLVKRKTVGADPEKAEPDSDPSITEQVS
jgi:predicted PurR-regulated permease PerM